MFLLRKPVFKHEQMTPNSMNSMNHSWPLASQLKSEKGGMAWMISSFYFKIKCNFAGLWTVKGNCPYLA